MPEKGKKTKYIFLIMNHTSQRDMDKTEQAMGRPGNSIRLDSSG